MQAVGEGWARSFHPGRGSAAAARAWTLECLRRLRWPAGSDRETQAVVLAVSELVTNAHRHACCAARLSLVWDGHRLLVSVCDDDGRLPQRRRTPVGLPGCHGLALVEGLADSWGTTSQAAGKSVWALFLPRRRRPADPARSPARSPAG